MKLSNRKLARSNKGVSRLQIAPTNDFVQSASKNGTMSNSASISKNVNVSAVQKIFLFRKHFVQNHSITEVVDLNSKEVRFRSKSNIQFTLGDFNEIEQLGPYLVNVCPGSGYAKSEWSQLYNPQKRCHCDKSSCLQNYCVCYMAGNNCNSSCYCHNCKNNCFDSKQEGSSPLRKKIKLDRQQMQNNCLQLKEEIRCRCSKTNNCLQSYCGCHRLGINCSDQCECTNCQN